MVAGGLTVDYVGSSPQQVNDLLGVGGASNNADNAIFGNLPAIATDKGGKTTNYDPSGFFRFDDVSEYGYNHINFNKQATNDLLGKSFANYEQKFKDGSILGEDAGNGLKVYSSDKETGTGRNYYAFDANKEWKYTPSSDKLSEYGIRGDHTLYFGGGFSENDVLREIAKLDNKYGSNLDLGKENKTNSDNSVNQLFGVGVYQTKDDFNHLTLLTSDKNFLTVKDDGKTGVFSLPSGSIVDQRELNAFERENNEVLKAAGLIGGGGTTTYGSFELIGKGTVDGINAILREKSKIDEGIKSDWWSINKAQNEWLPAAMNSSYLTDEAKKKLKEDVKYTLEEWSPTSDVLDTALLIGGVGAGGKIFSSGGKIGSKTLSPLIQSYEKLQS